MVEPIQLDDSLWPLIIFRFTDVATDRQFEEYLSRMDVLLQRREPFVSINDVTRSGLYTAAHRIRQAEWLQRNEATLRALGMGHATIVTSPIIRLSLSLLLYLKPLPFAHVAVADMNSAVKWAARRLRDHGRSADAERILRHFGLGTG